jgi:hypothetical protein
MPVASARKTPIYAEENAMVSTALITPYDRAYVVSELLSSEKRCRRTDFKKHNVIKGIINDRHKRPRRYSEGKESIHSRCSGIAGYITMPATRRSEEDAYWG